MEQKQPARKPREKKTVAPTGAEVPSAPQRGEITTLKRRVLGGYDRRRVTAEEHDEKKHGPSMVQQHFKEECDINRIILKFTETGFVSHQMPGLPSYGYAPETNFHEAMCIVTEAQETFNALPAELRAEFNNDPGAFLEAFNDESKKELLQEYGLINPDVQPEAVLVRLEGDMPGATDQAPAPVESA